MLLKPCFYDPGGHLYMFLGKFYQDILKKLIIFNENMNYVRLIIFLAESLVTSDDQILM